jgi:hypothetical protein
MSLRDSLLALADSVRSIPATLGLRTIRVWIRSSTCTKAALIAGGSTANTDVEITPRPAVVEQDAVDASYWGAEAAGLVQGQSLTDIYQIGPITPDFAAGGYALGDLLPIRSTPTSASRILLADEAAGGKLGTTAVEFELLAIKGQDKGRSLRWTLLVRRCRTNSVNG